MAKVPGRHLETFLATLARQGVTVENVRYARPEAGGEVDAHRLTPTRGPARRTPVLFLHATGNDAFFPQLALFRALLAQGYAVFTFDLDGHGRRSTTRLTPAAAGSMVPAALAAAGFAAAPVHLVGQSLGGALALAAVAAGTVKADAVRTLTLLSTPTRLAPEAGLLGRELVGLLRRAVRAQARDYGAYGLLPAVGPFKRRSYPVRLAGARGGALAYVAVVTELVNRLGLGRAASAVKTPALLVYGLHDKLVPPEQGRELAEQMARARLLLVPGGTHFSTPFEPGVDAAIVEFLTEADHEN